MTAEDIKQSILKGERLKLEAKRAGTDIPKSIWETYSAFANTVGGTILLGVYEDTKEKDASKRFEIQGVADARKIISDFWNVINSNKVSANILVDDNVEAVEVDGKEIVCIHVPQAN